MTELTSFVIGMCICGANHEVIRKFCVCTDRSVMTKIEEKDMTTLYFEASDEDDLRKAGFSKAFLQMFIRCSLDVH